MIEQFGTALIAIVAGAVVISLLFNNVLTESLWNMDVGTTHYSIGDNVFCDKNKCEITSDGEIVHINFDSPKVEYSDTNCVITGGLINKGQPFDWKDQIGKCVITDENTGEEIDLKNGYFFVEIENPGEYIDEEGNSHVLVSKDIEGNLIFNTDYTGTFSLKYTLNYRYQTVETIATYLIKDPSYDFDSINLNVDSIVCKINGTIAEVDNYILESGGIKYYTKPSLGRFIFIGIERNKTYKLYSMKGKTKTYLNTIDYTQGQVNLECSTVDNKTVCKLGGSE